MQLDSVGDVGAGSTKRALEEETMANVLEQAIENNRAALKAMDVDPDPQQMRSFRMGLELEIEAYSELLDAWRNGKPILTHFPSSGLARALGAPHMLYQDAFPAWRDPQASVKLYQEFENMGMPSYMCDTFAVPAAAVKSGMFPPPVVATSGTGGGCRVWMYHMKTFAEYFGVPTFDIDTPIRHDEEGIKYLAQQLAGLIEFVERHVPGLKYDEDRHIKIQQDNRTWVEYCLKEYELRGHVPLPLSNMESIQFVGHFDPSLYPNRDKVLEYWRTRVEELQQRVKDGVNREERLRVLWIFPLPLYSDIFSIMDQFNASLVALWLPPMGAYNGWRANWGDETEFGRKLTPLEEEARFMLGEDNYRGSEWASNVVKMCRDLSCDAIVYHECIGCSHIGGLARLVADTVAREVGVPTHIIKSGKLYDPAGWPAAESNLKIFLETVLGGRERR